MLQLLAMTCSTKTCLCRSTSCNLLSHLLYLETIDLLQGKSVSSLQSSLEAMQATAHSLKEELGSDLLSQLCIEDQREVDHLNDTIKQLTLQNREAWQERIRVSSVYVYFCTCIKLDFKHASMGTNCYLPYVQCQHKLTALQMIYT